jgi:hypothetical protein
MIRRAAMLLSALLCACTLQAQEADVALNLFDLADFLTLNVDASLEVCEGFRVTAGAKYNPWTFNAEGRQFQNRKRLFSAGVKRDFEHLNGWAAGTKLQYLEYNSGGFISNRTYEGDAYGAGLYIVWSIPLKDPVSLELGAGFWGGYEFRTQYACPRCGKALDSGGRFFLRPNDISVGIKYAFNTLIHSKHKNH